MKHEQTQSSGTMRLVVASIASSLVAAVVYALTFSDYLFPGESAGLFAQWTGLSPLSFPEHPLWGKVVAMLGGSASPTKVNGFSLVCGAYSAGLLCWLVSFFVRNCVRQEDAVRVRSGAALAAGLAAAFAFTFSVPAWHASTHLECRVFDVAFALTVFWMFVPMTRGPKALGAFAALAGVAAGCGLVESVIFVPLLPVYMLALSAIAMRGGGRFYLPVATFFLAAFVSYFVVGNLANSSFVATASATAGGYDSSVKVFTESVSRYVHEMSLWVRRPGWLFIQLFTVLPFVACAFAAGRGLNNERTWSQYAFHVAMTVCSIFAIATPLSPEGVVRQFGIEPVALTAAAAAVCGYLVAYWWTLMRSPLPKKEYESAPVEAKFGKQFAPAAFGVYVLVVALASLVNSFSCGGGRGAFADVCADEIVKRLGERSWFVTDGTLDDHLRVAAAKRGKELNLVCLHRDMDDAYLKEFADLVKAKNLKAGRANLSLSISLGILPFIQDWFSGDPDAGKKAAVFGVPDIWYVGERSPVPECLFFGGAKNVKAEVDGAKAKADFLAFWKSIEPWLPCEKGKGSREISKTDDPVARFRLQLRRHVGFVANNLGVTLQDVGRDDDAFEIYELVLKTIDPDNICALFNEFEMARAKVKAAMSRRVEIEKKLRAIVDDTKRRYVLWSLSRYYGYIRSPEIFARMGFAWARSGQTGNAIAQVQRAIDFIPAERQAGLLNMMAQMYASGNDMQKSRATYEKVLASDASNHDALLGLTRLALKAGQVEEAKNYLTQAVKSAGKNQAVAGFDNAFLSLMNNDLVAARVALQKVTDLQPKSLQAWSLLAGVLLQQADQAEEKKDETGRKKAIEELENVILPRMEAVADSPRDYFLQVTRALVLMRKGTAARKQARDAFAVAMMARPDVSATADMLLSLDIQLDDPESAERHARIVLRRDRHDRLGNYVMGSIRLKEGDYSTAETFLRTSVAADKALPAALNDLAETLRRLQRYDEAEVFARRCTKEAPDLYVAWETLGSILLDANKNLDEAEAGVKKAIQIAKEKNGVDDVRMQITLARVQLAKGDFGRARGTIRALRSRESELSNYDRNEVEKLVRASQKK